MSVAPSLRESPDFSDNPAGAWVQSNLNACGRREKRSAHQLSAFQAKAVDVLARGLRTGVYNVQVNWKRVDWDWGHGVRFVLRTSGLATFDFNHLTRLVILAHEECVRVDVGPHSFQYLAVTMHPRTREGSTYARHPTIEDAVAVVRGLPLADESARKDGSSPKDGDAG